MVDVIVRATATRWAADEFPGWVEASVLDARGKKHRIVEKVPVLTSLRVTAESPFPFEFWIAAEVDGRGGGPAGRAPRMVRAWSQVSGLGWVRSSSMLRRRPSCALAGRLLSRGRR